MVSYECRGAECSRVVRSTAIVSASGFSWGGEKKKTFLCGTVRLEGSGSFGINVGLEFFGILVISLGDSLGWRKAVSRIAAPGGLVLGHRRSPTEGVVPGPSGDASGCEPHGWVLRKTL